MLTKNGKPLKSIGIRKAMDLMRVNDARLVKMHTDASPDGFAHYIIPGGYVDPATAEKIKHHPLVTASKDGLFPSHDQTWRIDRASEPAA
jgi:hypothetical protein